MRKIVHSRVAYILVIAILGGGMIVCTYLYAPTTWGISGSQANSNWKAHGNLSVSFIETWSGETFIWEQEYDEKETILFFYRNKHAFSVLRDAVFANTSSLYIAKDNGSFISQANTDRILNFDKIAFYMDLLHIQSISYSTEFGNHSIYYKRANFPHKYLSIQFQSEADERLVYSKIASIQREGYAGWWELGQNWFYPDKPYRDNTGPACGRPSPRPSGDTLEGFLDCLRLYFEENLPFSQLQSFMKHDFGHWFTASILAGLLIAIVAAFINNTKQDN